MKSFVLKKSIIVRYGRMFLDQPFQSVIRARSIIECRIIEGVLYGQLPGYKPLKYVSKNPMCIWPSKIPREAINIESLTEDLRPYFIEGGNIIAPFPCFAKDQGLYKVTMYPDCSFVDYYDDNCILKKETLISKDDMSIQSQVDEVLQGKTLIAFRKWNEMEAGLIAPITSVRANVGQYEVETPHEEIEIGKSYWIKEAGNLYSWRGYGGKIVERLQTENGIVISYHEIHDFNRISKEIKTLTLNSEIIFIEKLYETLLDEILKSGLIAKIISV